MRRMKGMGWSSSNVLFLIVLLCILDLFFLKKYDGSCCGEGVES